MTKDQSLPSARTNGERREVLVPFVHEGRADTGSPVIITKALTPVEPSAPMFDKCRIAPLGLVLHEEAADRAREES